jgi:hypothetical protein
MPKDTREIWVADSETDPFELGLVPEPFIWGLYHDYGDGLYREFVDTDDFVDFVSKQRIILYAHNGGKFDWHFISHRFEPDSDLLVINGRLARFTIGNCEFRDSFNLMPVALEQYQKMKFDYTKMLKAYRDEHMDEIREYLKDDCVNLWNMVHGFDEAYGRHITQASAAMHFWKTRLGNKVPRSDARFYDTMKPFYFGGRVQCFEYGDLTGDFQSVDINSAYPYAMLSPHPYSLEYEIKDGAPKKRRSSWGPMLFVVECVARGCFPYRGTNQNLYFPADDIPRRYFVTGWELLAALETETIEEMTILEHYEFEETRDFSEYVMHFWNLRQEFKAEGDKGGEFYCKIFLNSLYGKFGMDIRKHKNYKLKPRSEIPKLIARMSDGETIQDFREWAILCENAGTGRKKFYNLATAASVTGFVRAMLWKAICKADRPLYCDTDSITAQAFGPEVTLSKELGDWEIEYEYDRVIICGKKLYAMHKRGTSLDNGDNWKMASKGAKLTHKDMIKIAAGEVVKFDNIAPTFSVNKERPTFISRDIRATARDITTVPERFDPLFVHNEENENVTEVTD